jgi:hypothetical protein
MRTYLFPFNPSPENLALFKFPAAIMNRLFGAEAVYADDKAIIGWGVDKGAMFSSCQYSRFFYVPMLPFVAHILFFRLGTGCAIE